MNTCLCTNGLHRAASVGCMESTEALLAQGSADVDGRDGEGLTPLMYAAVSDQAPVARLLINRGANMSLVCELMLTALHYSALKGHAGVAEVLINAGACLEGYAERTVGAPLHFAAQQGNWEVMRTLIDAGANVDSVAGVRRTPLYLAAEQGHVNAVRELLRAKANPLLTWNQESGKKILPLDAAACRGHLEVVNEMMRHVGIEGCGGPSGGVHALLNAAHNDHVGILAILTDAGVVDTGEALVHAVGFGGEASVKYLLHQQQQQQQQQQRQEEGGGGATGGDAYVNNTTNADGSTPLFLSIWHCRPCTPRLVRLLVDAGADTAPVVPLTKHPGGEVKVNQTPLTLANGYLANKTVDGREATEEQLNALEAIRRLLLQAEAVHAVSWLWHSGAPLIPDAATEGATRTTTPSTPLTLIMPTLRRRAARRGVLLSALCRQSSKP